MKFYQDGKTINIPKVNANPILTRDEKQLKGLAIDDKFYSLKDKELETEINEKLDNKLDKKTYESDKEEFDKSKQNALISGTNIKTINGESILGEGDLEIKGGSDTELYEHNVNINYYGSSNNIKLEVSFQIILKTANALTDYSTFYYTMTSEGFQNHLIPATGCYSDGENYFLIYGIKSSSINWKCIISVYDITNKTTTSKEILNYHKFTDIITKVA